MGLITPWGKTEVTRVTEGYRKGAERADPVSFLEQKHICGLERDEETIDHLVIMCSPGPLEGPLPPKVQSILPHLSGISELKIQKKE